MILLAANAFGSDIFLSYHVRTVSATCRKSSPASCSGVFITPVMYLPDNCPPRFRCFKWNPFCEPA